MVSEEVQRRRIARRLVRREIMKGLLVPQDCERCDTDKNINAHHEDYSKPLDVTWLCASCHIKRHEELTPGYRKQRRAA